MRTFESVDDFAQAVGGDLGVSPWHAISQEDVDQFARITNDEQWIHVDPERAKTGPFGTTVAHGYLTLALIPGFMRSIYAITGQTLGVNYGSNKVRYPAPVPVGSRVRGRAKLLSVERTDAWSQAVIQMTIEQEGGEAPAKPACVAEIVSRIYAG
jgi:Acyl dehydratase